MGEVCELILIEFIDLAAAVGRLITCPSDPDTDTVKDLFASQPEDLRDLSSPIDEETSLTHSADAVGRATLEDATDRLHRHPPIVEKPLGRAAGPQLALTPLSGARSFALARLSRASTLPLLLGLLTLALTPLTLLRGDLSVEPGDLSAHLGRRFEVRMFSQEVAQRLRALLRVCAASRAQALPVGLQAIEVLQTLPRLRHVLLTAVARELLHVRSDGAPTMRSPDLTDTLACLSNPLVELRARATLRLIASPTARAQPLLLLGVRVPRPRVLSQHLARWGIPEVSARVLRLPSLMTGHPRAHPASLFQPRATRGRHWTCAQHRDQRLTGVHLAAVASAGSGRRCLPPRDVLAGARGTRFATGAQRGQQLFVEGLTASLPRRNDHNTSACGIMPATLTGPPEEGMRTWLIDAQEFLRQSVAVAPSLAQAARLASAPQQLRREAGAAGWLALRDHTEPSTRLAVTAQAGYNQQLQSAQSVPRHTTTVQLSRQPNTALRVTQRARTLEEPARLCRAGGHRPAPAVQLHAALHQTLSLVRARWRRDQHHKGNPANPPDPP